MINQNVSAEDERIRTPITPYFQKALLEWFGKNARDLPWRRTKDPYHIWLSEMMLQQTRVDQAMPYYHAFLDAFPTVYHLAEAPLDAVLKRWEGLGYYARARNLHKAALKIVLEYQGVFPKTEQEALALPGVGPYSAAAILSIAFQVPLAVLDGNVIRVLARVLSFEADVRQPNHKAMLQDWANFLLNRQFPGNHNEAIMELGATICTHRKPLCGKCPLQPICKAYQNQRQNDLPFSSKKPKVPHHQIAVGVVFNDEGQMLINRRPDEGLLGGLWEFPGGKQEPLETLEETCKRELAEELGIEVSIGEKFAVINHAYTHFKITLHAFLCTLRKGDPISTNGQPIQWVKRSELDQFAFPKANNKVIEALKTRRITPTFFDETHK